MEGELCIFEFEYGKLTDTSQVSAYVARTEKAENKGPMKTQT